MRIFLVDDDASILEIMGMDLSRESHEVEVFGSAVDALHAAGTRRPDILVVDLNMPNFGGLDLLALLQARGCAPLQGAILVTTDCDRRTLARAHGLGVTGSLSKPFTRSDLVAAIERAARPSTKPCALTSPAPLPTIAARPLHILSVEDTAANRELISMVLGDAGHRVVTASTGSEGLEAMETHEFDVVLVDLRLPDVDGTEVIRWFREAERDGTRQRARILAVSADVSARALEEATAAGADQYVAKPFSTRQLIEAAESGWRVRSTMAGIGENTGSALDAAPLVSRVGSPAADRIFRAFTKQLDGFIALDGGAAVATIATVAHSLRGAAGMLGFHALAASCERLEASCESGQADQDAFKQAQSSGAAARSDAMARIALAA